MIPPPAEGTRLAWAAVPEAARAAFDGWAASMVVRAVSQPSGFSPGVAARVQLADGRRLFVKAVGPEPNPDSPDIHRREARIVAALPEHIPVPRLRWWLDHADTGWVILAFDEVEGRHPSLPWVSDELDTVIAGLVELNQALTPSPITDVPTASEMLTTRLCGWQRLRDSTPAALDDWSRRHLHALAELEARAPAAVMGETLLHFDVRADNVLLDSNHAWFFDWPHACLGAAWLDAVGFAPSVTMQGGPPPDDVIRLYPNSRTVDVDLITAAIASLAGYFTRQSLEPPPPGIPTVRAFQAAQGVVAREWLACRTGWA